GQAGKRDGSNGMPHGSGPFHQLTGQYAHAAVRRSEILLPARKLIFPTRSPLFEYDLTFWPNKRMLPDPYHDESSRYFYWSRIPRLPRSDHTVFPKTAPIQRCGRLHPL